jgi:GNAT superfamily N-acetyltransferase
VIRDLGDGLILRRATAADADELAVFNARVMRDDDEPENRPVELWVRELTSGAHPTTRAEDFTVVEDTRTGRIVSSLVLMSQRATYGGVPFGLGQVELVGTHPDYRRRGLIRQQVEVVHGWSRERGELVQAIGGISWYYRQFAYEYALAMGGFRTIYLAQLPKLPEGAAEPFRLRPATADDIPFLIEVDAVAARRYLVFCPRDEVGWGYQIGGHRPGSLPHGSVQIVETVAGEAVGFAFHLSQLRDGGLVVERMELRPGASWLPALPSILRALAALGPGYARPEAPFTGLRLALGADHPAYAALRDVPPAPRPLYAWYVRVADLPGFVRHVAPALEARLAASPAAGHTGQLRLTFYRSGLTLRLEGGLLGPVEPTDGRGKSDAAFPDLTFVQLLFGWRSFDELAHAFPDCSADTPDAVPLLDALFPRHHSRLWTLE